MSQTPWQAERDRAERSGTWPDPAWGPFHRHFCGSQIHRDGGPECDQPGMPRRVYMFDAEYLDAHERAVAAWAIANPAQFADLGGAAVHVGWDITEAEWDDLRAVLRQHPDVQIVADLETAGRLGPPEGDLGDCPHHPGQSGDH